jgi:hypothetical protein
MIQDRWLESYQGTRTRPAVARSASTTAAAAPSAPPLPSVDRLAQRTAPRPTAISTMTDDQIVRSQFTGSALTIVTVDPIDLAQVKAGQTLRAKIDVTSQLRFLQPAEAERLQALMNDVDVRLNLAVSGAVLSYPRLAVTVDSVSFRGQDIPAATYDLPQVMRVKPELAHSGGRGRIPDSWWELPAKTGMTFRSKQSSDARVNPSAPAESALQHKVRRR